MVTALSARGFGPRVFVVFEGGRVEQFWASRRLLLPSEALQQAPVDFATLTAARLAELHELRLTVPGRATAEEQLARWLGAVEGGGPVDLEALRAAIASAPALRPAASTQEEATVASVLLQRTLCHLDLFAANLMYDHALGEVQFIDYEYPSDAPVGLDNMANQPPVWVHRADRGRSRQLRHLALPDGSAAGAPARRLPRSPKPAQLVGGGDGLCDATAGRLGGRGRAAVGRVGPSAVAARDDLV